MCSSLLRFFRIEADHLSWLPFRFRLLEWDLHPKSHDFVTLNTITRCSSPLRFFRILTDTLFWHTYGFVFLRWDFHLWNHHTISSYMSCSWLLGSSNFAVKKFVWLRSKQADFDFKRCICDVITRYDLSVIAFCISSSYFRSKSLNKILN